MRGRTLSAAIHVLPVLSIPDRSHCRILDADKLLTDSISPQTTLYRICASPGVYILQMIKNRYFAKSIELKSAYRGRSGKSLPSDDFIVGVWVRHLRVQESIGPG